MADTTKIYENIFIKKNAAGDREYIKVPYAILADPPTIPDVSGLMPKSGGTFTGEVKFGSTENFQGYYIKRMLGYLGAGTAYNNLDSSYKDGTWHRMWRLRFPSGSSFWGKIKITLYGGYSSFNASGVMSKSITCNFNTSNIYNNVGCYDGLGVNVEQDFRISEAIWNATASAWEVLIWQKNLSGNNSPAIMLECWTTNNTNYINAFNGITAQTVELTQSTSYSAHKASSTGGTKTVTWATLPVYENPLGEEIATVAMLEDKQDKITSSNKLKSSLVDGLGAAAAKAVDTAITANSTSTNLPTSKAVEDRINAHSGIDKVGTVTGVMMNGTTKNPSSGVVDIGTVLTDESKFATAAQGTKADNALPISGGELTGGISAPNISTGTAAANYFQSQKFRGEGNADTYYHAVDFGYAGHNQVDFHEYGGLYNFYQNTNGASDTGHLVGAFTPDGIKEGEQLLKDKYLGKSGGTITGDLTVGGNLTINGTTTTVDSTTLQVKDKLIEVAKDNTEKLTTPAGIVVPKYDGTSYGALVIDGDGNAQVGDVKLDDSGNIDVANSDLQTLATRTGLVGGNLVQYDSSALTLKDSGKKIGDLALKTDLNSKANLSGGNTFSGNQVITGYLDIRGTAAEKHLKTRGIGGSDGNGNSSDLYLQYSSDYKTYFGKTAQSSLNADGSISINGKTAATTDQIPDISGKQDTITASNKLSASLVSGLSNVATSGSYNDLLDKPSFDKLTRIQKQAYTGGNNTVQYFKLASFPVYNSGGNYASFIITGRMGGWQSDNMSFVNMILYNRNGEGGGYINVANSAFFNLCDVVMYREADGTTTAYLKVKGYYTFDININTYQAVNVYTGTDDTPTGTLKWTASEQADRLAVSGGVAYVNGFTIPKQVQINGATFNPNSAGLINLGTNFAKTSDIPDVSGKQDKLTAGSNITISGNTISATVPTMTFDGTTLTINL